MFIYTHVYSNNTSIYNNNNNNYDTNMISLNSPGTGPAHNRVDAAFEHHIDDDGAQL